jgi:hypothetical protein
MLDNKQQEKWYFKNSILVIAFMSVGPLALLLVWFNPRFSNKKKIIITIIIVVLSVYSAIMLAKSIKIISEYYQQMLGLTL